jgi:hypothetical protein
MPPPLGFEALKGILHRRMAQLPDHRKQGPNTRYTIQDAAGGAFGQRVLHHPTNTRVDRDGCVLHPAGAVRAVLVGHPRAVRAIDTPDRERWAPRVLRHRARHTLRRRRDLPLVHVGHQSVGIGSAPRIHPLVDRVSPPRTAHHAHQGPRPRATQAFRGPGREMLPTRSLGLLAPPGGKHMQMGRRVPIAAMRVEHRDGAPLERLPSAKICCKTLQSPEGAASIRVHRVRRVGLLWCRGCTTSPALCPRLPNVHGASSSIGAGTADIANTKNEISYAIKRCRRPQGLTGRRQRIPPRHA